MNRVAVVSSNLAAVGYDPVAHTLEVAFKDGSVYQYFDVPSDLHVGLMAASSHGKYFEWSIKRAGYRYQQIA